MATISLSGLDLSFLPKKPARGKTVYRHDGRKSKGPEIVRDIEPYRSVVTGEIISGRRQHREHLREHGLVETGNETLERPARKTEMPDPRHDLAQAMKEKGVIG